MEALDVLRRARLDVARDGVRPRRGAQAFEARHAGRLRPASGGAVLALAALSWAASPASATPDPLAALRSALDAGDLPRAVREGERAVEADPKSSDARDLLGRAYGLTAKSSTLLEQMRLARKARSCFAAAVELDPGNAAALSDLARYDMRAPGVLGGGRKKARAVIERVMALDPERGHVLLGELAEIERQPLEAEAEFRRAVAVAPDGYRGREALSGFLVSGKRYAEARTVWLEARELGRVSAIPEYELAGIALASGEQLEEAARQLAGALSRPTPFGRPPGAALHERLAAVYERLGKRSDAAAELEAALTLDPERSDWRRRLAGLEP